MQSTVEKGTAFSVHQHGNFRLVTLVASVVKRLSDNRAAHSDALKAHNYGYTKIRMVL